MMASNLYHLAGPAMLFCPADRPDRFGKALERADSIIIDLEDAVHAENKQKAREDLQTWCRQSQNMQHLKSYPIRLVVRINPVNSSYFHDDLDLIRSLPVRAVMVPKAESTEDMDAVVEQLPDVSVIALCETPRGIIRAEELAQHQAVHALMWGAEDLIAESGGSSSRHDDGTYRDVVRQARSRVLLGASAFNKPAIDSIYADFSNTTALATEARDASASGFSLKACIHPMQTGVVRSAFAPTKSEVKHAQGLLAAVKESRGAVQFRGAMVDEPLIRHAEQVLRRAGLAEAELTD